MKLDSLIKLSWRCVIGKNLRDLASLQIVTNQHRGIYVGTVVWRHSDGSVTVANARHVTYWKCFVPGGLSSLAVYGPEPSTRAGAPAPSVRIADVANVWEQTPEAIAKWKALDPHGEMEPWSGGSEYGGGSGAGDGDGGDLFDRIADHGSGLGDSDGAGGHAEDFGFGQGEADGNGYGDGDGDGADSQHIVEELDDASDGYGHDDADGDVAWGTGEGGSGWVSDGLTKGYER